MTRKEYVLIATAINNAITIAKHHTPKSKRKKELDGIRLVIQKISESLAGNNSRFNPDKFRIACGFYNPW